MRNESQEINMKPGIDEVTAWLEQVKDPEIPVLSLVDATARGGHPSAVRRGSEPRLSRTSLIIGRGVVHPAGQLVRPAYRVGPTLAAQLPDRVSEVGVA